MRKKLINKIINKINKNDTETIADYCYNIAIEDNQETLLKIYNEAYVQNLKDFALARLIRLNIGDKNFWNKKAHIFNYAKFNLDLLEFQIFLRDYCNYTKSEIEAVEWKKQNLKNK